MIFTVTSIIKNKNTFSVVSDSGESMIVSANQILSVLLQGFQFTNVKLTRKGFAVNTPQGTRYTQLNMSKETAAKVKFILDKQNESMKMQQAQMQQAQMQQAQMQQAQMQQAQMQQAQCRSVQNIQRPKTKSAVQKINNNNSRNKVVYKGEVFLSDERLCKKFNRDVNTFRKLREKGYTMDEALGLIPLRPESELLMTRSQTAKRTDSYFAAQNNGL